MKKPIPELRALRSNRFMLYVAIFAVIFLTPNSYYVFHKFSVFISPYREIASAGVSAIVASFIMIFTVRKNKEVTYYFALFEVMVSAYYYITILGWSWDLIPAFGFTIILPVAVYFSSREIDVNTLDMEVDWDDKDMIAWLEKNPKKKPTDYYKELLKLQS